MPTGGGGSGVTPSSNPQVNSLGVGVAASGSSGHVDLGSPAQIRAAASDLILDAFTSTINNNGNIFKNIARISLSNTDPGINKTINLPGQTFASLPAAAAGNAGTLAIVTDSTVATWGSTITGGGGNTVLALSDGAAWTVVGK